MPGLKQQELQEDFMPVPTSPCPHCQGLSLWLENLSREAIVDYYRCSKCSYVWSVSKDGTGSMTAIAVKSA
jgi:hypothetical protein